MISKRNIHLIIVLGMVLLLSSCAKEEALPVTADFSVEILNADEDLPIEVRIINNTDGGESFLWDFGSGIPASSTEEYPGTVFFTAQGEYTITLEASNIDGSFDSTETTFLIDVITDLEFETTIIDDNFSPMEVEITNNTLGANRYSWTFEGGTPSSSTEQHPPNVIFEEPGDHTITLVAYNTRVSRQIQQTVTVAPELQANFSFETTFEDDDYQAPVTISTTNNSISATAYQWNITGPESHTSTEENPNFTLQAPGTYTITLEATNGKKTHAYTQEILVLENTNLRTFTDIKLGINTAHAANTTGAFFSTETREVYTKEEVTDTNGSSIDLVFFALNNTFSFSKFISPDEADTTTFDAIPSAMHTKFINLQESCECTASLSVSEFDTMTDDTLLSALTIEETDEGLEDFDSTVVPRIVLFENAKGQKGAIKIKEFVVDGQNSYITVDIKIQKEAN